MAAAPLEKRIDRLPNWAQAYIGRLNRQILQLKEHAGSVKPDPSPVFSEDMIDGDPVKYYLPLQDNGFTIDMGDSVELAIHVGEREIEIGCNQNLHIIPLGVNAFRARPSLEETDDFGL